MSSCLINGGGRPYRLDLDIVSKPSSPSSRSSHASSPLSALSESSSSAPFSISTKRARAPRKRPNQSSAEASALLSTISPKLFSSANLRRANYFPVLLPSFPIPDDAALLLLREPPLPENKIPARLQPKMHDSSNPPFFQLQAPGSPDFDAESILDEEVEESIDSILGMRNLSMSPDNGKDADEDRLMGFGGFRFGLGILLNTRRAMKRNDDGEWWTSPVVSVKDIIPRLKEQSLKAKKKKKKKKKEKVEEDDVEGRDITSGSFLEDGILKPQLGLKLNYDGVLKEWSGGSPFSGDADSEKCSGNVIARLANIDLFSDAGSGVMKEASMQQYKEKRRNRLFSKKVCYQVRKVNADQRPQMKVAAAEDRE